MTAAEVSAWWWLFRATEIGALSVMVAVTARDVRRVGAATAYGSFLAILALGFWLILGGVLLVNSRRLILPRPPPGGLPDAVSLTGWILVGLAFLLFTMRFGRAETGFARVGPAVALRVGLALAVAAGLFLLLAGPDPWANAANPWRLAFLLVDFATLAIGLASVEGMFRLREGALGHLHMTLVGALLLKTTGDAAYLAGTRWEIPRDLASAFYPLAGLVAMAGVVRHHRRLRDSPFAVPDPSLRLPEKALRDALIRLERIAGSSARHRAIDQMTRVLRMHGADYSVSGAVLRADAHPEVWAEGFRVVREETTRLLGPGVAQSAGFPASEAS